MILDRDGAIERPGEFLLEASAFIIVCLGIESTDSALLRWPWKVLGAFRNSGDVGKDGERSVGEASPTVVAAEKDSSLPLSYSWDLERPSVFRDSSWRAYSRRREFPMLEVPFFMELWKSLLIFSFVGEGGPELRMVLVPLKPRCSLILVRVGEKDEDVKLVDIGSDIFGKSLIKSRRSISCFCYFGMHKTDLQNLIVKVKMKRLKDFSDNRYY